MTSDRVNTQIRLPVELHERLVQAASDRYLTVNYLVTAAVKEFLERLIPADEFKLTKD